MTDFFRKKEGGDSSLRVGMTPHSCTGGGGKRKGGRSPPFLFPPPFPFYKGSCPSEGVTPKKLGHNALMTEPAKAAVSLGSWLLILALSLVAKRGTSSEERKQ
jgi:hypothetical protein